MSIIGYKLIESEEAAAAVGAELGQIVKSLVFVAPRADGPVEPILCLVSGTNRVDVARLAAVTGEPHIRRATAREANELTGFVIGGIPPLGHLRTTRVVMDPDLGRFSTVWAAAGTRTAVLPVTPATLRALANAVVAPIAEEAQRLSDLDGRRARHVAAGEARARSGPGRLTDARRMGEPRSASVTYPGGLRVRYRWAGSGEGPSIFALTETGGSLTELGGIVGEQFEPMAAGCTSRRRRPRRRLPQRD